MATTTPWGPSQTQVKFIRGVNFYSTSSHGGIKVSKSLNNQIPAKWRNEDGWYEEDCEIAIPFTFLKGKLEGNTIDWEGVNKTLISYYPYLYELVNNTTLKPGESPAKDRAMREIG
jgi:hypothetical protein